MKFVLTMPLAPAGMEMMEKLGIQWEVGPGINWEAYPDALLESADALIIGWKNVRNPSSAGAGT